MKTFGKIVSRSLLTLAVAGLGLAVTPGTASADIVDFTVHEGVVPGTPAADLVAEGLTGKYVERLTLTSNDGGLTGTFSASLFVNWASYLSDVPNAVLVDSQLGSVGGAATDYAAYVVGTAVGTFAQVVPGLFVFEPTDADAQMYLDPLQNTTKTLPALGAGGDSRDHRQHRGRPSRSDGRDNRPGHLFWQPAERDCGWIQPHVHGSRPVRLRCNLLDISGRSHPRVRER